MRSSRCRRRAVLVPLCFASATLLLAAGCGGGKDGPTEPPKASTLRFKTEPTDVQAGEPLNPTIRVEVRDAAGQLVTGSSVQVTLALANAPAGAALVGATTAQSEGGVASFEGLKIERAGSGYALKASGTGLSAATSAAFTVRPAAAHRLAFLTIPAADAHVPVDSPVEVEVQDRFGNRVTDWVNKVTLNLEKNPGGAALTGTLTQTVAQGVARFDDLVFPRPGTGYTLWAEANALSAAESAPFRVRLTLVSEVTTGEGHTCGLAAGGNAYCWGFNGSGQLGTGGTTNSPTPAAVAGGLSFKALGTGVNHTCGLTTAGKAYCWGSNGLGQLGTGNTAGSSSPVAVTGNLTFSSLSVGAHTTCGITTGSQAYCWGMNGWGQLGTGNTTISWAPVAVSGGLSFKAVSANEEHTCGLTTAQQAYCWGRNNWGQLGTGTTTDSNVPVAVTGGLSFASLITGGVHTCGLTTTGGAYCWGDNNYGTLGIGSAELTKSTPTAVAGGQKFSSLSAGYRHTCGSTAAGEAYCWGYNIHGQLGIGTTTNWSSPLVAGSGGLTFAAISAGTAHTCGLTAGGETYCWGFNLYGQLGTGGTEGATTPVLVASTKR